MTPAARRRYEKTHTRAGDCPCQPPWMTPWYSFERQSILPRKMKGSRYPVALERDVRAGSDRRRVAFDRNRDALAVEKGQTIIKSARVAGRKRAGELRKDTERLVVVQHRYGIAHTEGQVVRHDTVSALDAES